MSDINAKEKPSYSNMASGLFLTEQWSLLIGKWCHRDPLIGLPHPHQGGAVNLSQTSRLRPTSITHSLLGLHSIVTQSTVVFTDSQPRLPPTPADHNDSLIRSLSHPPRNTISPKMGNYSKKYLHVIFMGWGLKCGRGIHCILRVRNWKTSSFKVIWNNNQTHNFLWRWKKKTCLSFQFRLLVV